MPNSTPHTPPPESEREAQLLDCLALALMQTLIVGKSIEAMQRGGEIDRLGILVISAALAGATQAAGLESFDFMDRCQKISPATVQAGIDTIKAEIANRLA